MAAMLTENLGRALIMAVGSDQAKRCMDAVIVRYGIPDQADVALNLALREHWRMQHGNTTAWDAAALAAGFNPKHYERS